jgi:hypothetical protein
MDLRGFILRARALQLYRDALRTVRRAPSHTHGAHAALHAPAQRRCALLWELRTPVRAVCERALTQHVCARAALCATAAGELRSAVRQAMDAGRDARGSDQIKFYLSEGKQRLKELTDMLGLAAVPTPGAGAAAAAAARAPHAAGAAAPAATPRGSCGTPGHKH